MSSQPGFATTPPIRNDSPTKPRIALPTHPGESTHIHANAPRPKMTRESRPTSNGFDLAREAVCMNLVTCRSNGLPLSRERRPIVLIQPGTLASLDGCSGSLDALRYGATS